MGGLSGGAGLGIALMSMVAFAEPPAWVEDDHGCKVFDHHPDLRRVIDWSGKCPDGKAAGDGTLTFLDSDNKPQKTVSGTYAEGDFSGQVLLQVFYGTATVSTRCTPNFYGMCVGPGTRDLTDYAHGAWHQEGVFSINGTGYGFSGDLKATRRGDHDYREYDLHDYREEGGHTYAGGTMRLVSQDSNGQDAVIDYISTRFVDFIPLGETRRKVVSFPYCRRLEGWTVTRKYSDSGSLEQYTVLDAQGSIYISSAAEGEIAGPLRSEYEMDPDLQSGFKELMRSDEEENRK